MDSRAHYDEEVYTFLSLPVILSNLMCALVRFAVFCSVLYGVVPQNGRVALARTERPLKRLCVVLDGGVLERRVAPFNALKRLSHTLRPLKSKSEKAPPSWSMETKWPVSRDESRLTCCCLGCKQKRRVEE